MANFISLILHVNQWSISAQPANIVEGALHESNPKCVHKNCGLSDALINEAQITTIFFLLAISLCHFSTFICSNNSPHRFHLGSHASDSAVPHCTCIPGRCIDPRWRKGTPFSLHPIRIECNFCMQRVSHRSRPCSPAQKIYSYYIIYLATKIIQLPSYSVSAHVSITHVIFFDAVAIGATEAIFPAATVVPARLLVAVIAAIIPSIAHAIFRLFAFPVLAGKALLLAVP